MASMVPGKEKAFEAKFPKEIPQRAAKKKPGSRDPGVQLVVARINP
jgi:hypothetical protein